ncbi:hypothetical protein AQUCO_01100491v1 [Aquilegia coerulea]|uniref:Pentacotripeptide-repeat region of PRORP domain-containing protein n=1 Tax=Aquilegia coerulea TaxID=218851 RepID=A0A2G5E7E8_AQUCA|nr:hypothetical protein AQUCO_01100491v1 [Aquilegia coerulea]
MNRAKGILASLRLIESCLLTRTTSTRSLHFQVTQFSLLPPLFSSSSFSKQIPSNYEFLNTPQKLYFSSKPNSIVELVMTNEWSDDLEQELEKSHLSHETILYVLKKLDRNPLRASDFFNWVSDKKGFKPTYSVYSIMLRILGNKETMKEFWVLAKKVSDEGCGIDEETYVPILVNFKNLGMMAEATSWTQFFKKINQECATDVTVKSVADVVINSDWNDDVKNRLKELNVKFSENTMLKVFRALRRFPLKALCLFHWVEEDIGYKHNAVTYNGILRVLCQEESIKEFWSMVKEMQSAGYDIDIDTYIKISRHLLKNKMLNDAAELYELMIDSPYKPSARACSDLLRRISMAATPDLDLVFRVVKKYESSGQTLSKALYDGIHRSLTSVGRFDEAEKILETMRNAGYEPDNITYSQIVFGLCKAGRLEEACEVLDEMEAQGCVPDIKTWTILIQGHCTTGEIDQALKCFTKMLEKNFEADADLLEVLVSGLCSKGRVDSAYTLLTEMVDKAKLRPWQATYKLLIQKLLGERKLEEALSLLRLMKKQKYPPFPEPFEDFISKFGTVDDAEEFLTALSVTQYPSSSAYVHLLKAFFKEGRQSEARDLLYKCPHHIRNHADVLNLFASPKEGNAIATA